ncbi:MAG: LacI family DNA-binding transcriptional regulator [Clostridium sp.]|nr:LacI family DNA-binding transcriptional regulator [Clostridium sp.]
MKVLIQDIAKKANVSAGTVSNALNNRKGISEEKREYILKIAKEMGYFKKGRNNIIRLLMINKKAQVLGDTPFFSELIRGIEMECSEQGFELLINQIYIEDNSTSLDDVLKVDSVDGILLLATEIDLDDLKMFKNLSIPVVILDTVFKDQEFDYVAINNVDAAYDIVTYMIKRGHKNIGLINSVQQINNFRERKLGYTQALEYNNLIMRPENEVLVEPSLEGAYEDMREFLSEYMKYDNEEFPTAFFAVNDNIALGAMKAIHEMGFNDVSIAGFDDLPLCNFCSPTLSTVRVDKQYLGKTAIVRLIEKINNNDEGRKKILIGTKVIERESIKEI